MENDDTSDKIVGLVLSLDDNGLPKKDCFGATVYLYMALNKCLLVQEKHPMLIFTWYKQCHLMCHHFV